MLKRTLVTSLTTLVLAAAMAGTAEAHHWSSSSFPSVNKSFKKAVAAWRGYLGHCVGSGIGVYAYAEDEYYDVGDAYAFVPEAGACDIYFNVDAPKNYRRPWFCSVMVHEMGHVAGFEHNADRRDIMNGPGEIYWRKCLTKRQARKYKKRGKIIDYSINSWAYAARSSRSRHHHPDAELTRDLEAGRLHVGRIAVLRP